MTQLDLRYNFKNFWNYKLNFLHKLMCGMCVCCAWLEPEHYMTQWSPFFTFSLSLQQANTFWQEEQPTSSLKPKQVNADVKNMSLNFDFTTQLFFLSKKNQKTHELLWVVLSYWMGKLVTIWIILSCMCVQTNEMTDLLQGSNNCWCI